MGIKFLCPNGHKLHVKSFLSGKRALCPKCGVGVTVPAEGSVTAGAGAASSSTQSSASSSSTGVAQHESDLDDLEIVVETTSAGKPKGAAGGSSSGSQSASKRDPIDEAGGAVWYVRPATGGQFGPASADIMRGWVNEGRIGASSLIWRAGWAEWQPAAAVFPQLGPHLKAPGQKNSEPGSAPHGAAAELPLGQAVSGVAPSPVATSRPAPLDPLGPASTAAFKRKRKNDISFMSSAILVAISLILVIVLFIVSRMNAEPKVPSIEPPATTEPATPKAAAI